MAKGVSLPRRRFIRLAGGKIEFAFGLLLASLLEARGAQASEAPSSSPQGTPEDQKAVAEASPAPLPEGIDENTIKALSPEELKALLDAAALKQLGLDAKEFYHLVDSDLKAAIHQLEAAFRNKIKLAAANKAVKADAARADASDHSGSHHDGHDGDGSALGGEMPLLLIIGALAGVGGLALAFAGGGGGGGGGDHNVIPTAANDAITTAEDAAVTFDVRTNDADANGDALIVTQINGTAITTTSPVTIAGGVISLGTDGRLTFTPTANFNGTPTFTYTVSDGHGGTATATVNLTVTPVNDAPVASADAVATAEDTPVTFDVRANDNDVDGNALTVTQINGTAITTTSPVAVTGGIVRLGTDGRLTFTPSANFNGTPSFTYTISDGAGGTATSTVSLTVTAVNDAPVNTVPTALASVQDSTVLVSGLSISDVDAGTSSLTTTLNVAHGSLFAAIVTGGATISGSGTGTLTLTGTLAQINATLTAITYAGTTGFSGSDTLTVTTNDGQATDTDTVPITIAHVASGLVQDGYVSGATVFIDVNGNGVFDPGEPTAQTDAQGRFTIASNAVGEIIAFGGVNSDTGLPNTITMTAPSGSTVINPLTTLVAAAMEQGQTLAEANASVSLALGLPAGTDLTNFDILGPSVDPAAALALQQASVQVATILAAAADAAVAGGEAAAQSAVLALLGQLLENGGVIDLTNLETVTSLLSVVPGITADQLTQASEQTTSTNQQIDQATSLQDIADTQVAVSNPNYNYPPATTDDLVQGSSTGPLVFDVRTNDQDPENGGLTVVAINGVSIQINVPLAITGGVLTLGQDGRLTFVPSADFHGSPSFEYTVADSAGATSNGYVNPLTAAADSATTATGASIVIDVLANDTNVDGDALTITAIDGHAITGTSSVAVEGGTVSLGAHGTLIFTSNAGFTGTPAFTYTVNDLHGSSTGSVGVTVGSGPTLAIASSDLAGAIGNAASLAAAGVDSFDVAGNVAAIGDDQASALVGAGIDFVTSDSITVQAAGTHLNTSLKGLQDLHVDSVAVGAGIHSLTLDAGAGGLGALSASDLPQFDIAQTDAALDVTLNVAAGTLSSGIDLGSLATALGAAGIDHIGVNGSGALGLTYAQATAIANAGVDIVNGADVTVGMAAADLVGVNAATLDAVNVDHIDLTDNVATISDAQASALVGAGVDFVAADTITVQAAGTHLNTSLKGLQELHVDSVAVVTGVHALTLDAGSGGLAGLSASDLPQFDVAQSDAALDVTLNVEAGALASTLDLASLASALGAAGIDHIGVAGSGTLSVSYAQAVALANAGIDFVDGANVTIHMDASGIAGIDTSALAFANVDHLDITGDVATISDAQAGALVAAGVDFVTSDAVTVEAAGTHLNTSLKGLQTLHVDSVAAGIGVDHLVLSAGDLSGVTASGLPQFDVAQSDAALDVTLRVQLTDLSDLERLAAALQDAGIDHFALSEHADGIDSATLARMQQITAATGIDFLFGVPNSGPGTSAAGGFAGASAGEFVHDHGKIYTELLSTFESSDDHVGGSVEITDGTASSLIEAGMLRAYLSDNLVLDATASGDRLLTTLKEISDIGVDEIRFADHSGDIVYVDLGIQSDAMAVNEIQALFKNLELASDDSGRLFSLGQKVGLVVDAATADALGHVDGAFDQLAHLGFTEVDVLAGTTFTGDFSTDAIEIKLIGQDDDLYHHLHHV